MSKETVNEAAVRDTLVYVYDTLEKLQPYGLHISDITVRRAFNGRLCRAKNAIDTALAKPPRNCDKFNHADEAYDQFMRYVRRENPSFTKPSPLHTVFDVLKWALDSERKEVDE
jgi:hypothetical protein